MKPTTPSAAARCSIPVAACLLATALPAAAGVVADVVIPAETGGMPEFRKKFGLEVSYYHQEQPYEVSSMALNVGGYPIPATTGSIENEVSNSQLKFDYDVLPFLNLFAIAGWVDGETTLTASSPMVPGGAIPFNIEYNGLSYGLGTTLSVGGEHWFAALTASYIFADLDLDGSDVEAFTVMPRVGGRWGNWTVWVGLFYLDTTEEHHGSYQVPVLGPIPLNYDVSLQQKDDISYLVGVNYAFSDSWNLTLEGGFGDRESYQAGLQWRF